MAKSPLHKSADHVTFDILVDGTQIKDTYQVVSISVERDINRIPVATFDLLLLTAGTSKRDFGYSESDDFKPGNKVTIQAGYRNRNNTIFAGIIVSHQIKSSAAVGSRLQVHCADESIKMTLFRQSQFFTDMKDQAIHDQLIDAYGLDKDTDDTTVTHHQLIQHEAIDWDFLLLRAAANGQLVYAEDGKVFVKKPLSSGKPDLVLTYGLDVIDFDAEIDTRFQLDSIETQSWSPKTQHMLKKSSQEPNLRFPGDYNGQATQEVLSTPPIITRTTAPLIQEELQAWADAELLQSRLTSIQGTFTFFGNELPKLNTFIQLDGFGNRFNGDALISGVYHTIEEGRWTTTVKVGLPAEWQPQQKQTASPPASGLLAPTHGLQLGTVKKIDADPEGEHRIQVTLPALGDPHNGIWARLSQRYATQGKGAFYMPEVGDEVVVGFLNDDPRYPVILGSLYSSYNAPPYTSDEQNTYKAFVSKNELKIEMNDKDKVLTVETPGGNQCVFSDKDKNIMLKDQNGNSIELSSSGIVIKSTKDVTIEAKGQMNLKAKQNLTANASSGDLKMEGINVTCKAQVAFSAQGNASAELKASGQTTVKGAMVMIN